MKKKNHVEGMLFGEFKLVFRYLCKKRDTRRYIVCYTEMILQPSAVTTQKDGGIDRLGKI